MNNALLLANWTVTDVDPTPAAYRFTASYNVLPEHCPHCGTVGRLYRHGPKTIEYTDAPVHGRHSVIMVETSRWKCLECGKTFMQPLPDMEPGRMMTRRCAQYVENCVPGKNNQQIARETGLHEKTVRQIVAAADERREARHKATLFAPLVLGIDELRLAGKLRTVFTDVANRRILDIIEDREKARVNHWLSWLPGSERVRIVTIDMWAPYRDVVQFLMPDALIIVDRFHVQKALNEALDTVRVRYSREQKTKKARLAVLRKRKLLQMSRRKLEQDRPHVLVMLDAWLDNNPLLRDAYDAKELLTGIWDCQTAEEAESYFEWLQPLIADSVKAEFGEAGFSGMVRRWRKHIFPFFDFRYTNAYTEASNGIVKMLNRAGRGYKFPQIRARALAYRRLSGPDMYACERCLTRFEAQDGMFFHLGVSFCPSCAETHIWAALRKMGHSTSQSE